MTPAKYKFNPDSLSFDKIRLGFKAVLLRFLAYFIGSVFIAIIYGLLYAIFFDSPKEKALLREIDQLTIQYEMMNKDLDNVEKVISHLEQTDDNLYRTIFEAEPIPATLREGGIGGVNRYKELEVYDNSKIVIETSKRLDRIRKHVYIQSRSFDELIVLAKEKEVMLASFPAIMPIANKDLTRTASGFGMRIHPYYKISKLHNGMDFTAPMGTEIYVTGDGVVESYNQDTRGYGKHIIINHGFGYKTLYAHLDRANVRRGQKVKRGDVIGFVGNTGMSLAPHLHYEVHLNDVAVDPSNYYFNDLTAEEYDRMIELASRSGQTFD
jgi:murein DD-endopeptidase MepM/ murein hydrolase activator NlpD